MQLLINNQLIPVAIRPKSISPEQICYKRSQGIGVNLLHCLPFSTSKNKDLKRISKSATNVVLALKFLWTSNLSETKWLRFCIIRTSVMKELKELLCEGLTEKSWKYIRQFSLKLYLRSSFASRRLSVGCSTKDTGHCSFRRAL